MVSVCISASEVSSQVHTRCLSVCVWGVCKVCYFHADGASHLRIRREWESIISRSWTLCISSWGDNRSYYGRIHEEKPTGTSSYNERRGVCVFWYKSFCLFLWAKLSDNTIAQTTICSYGYVSIIASNNSHLIQVVLIWLYTCLVKLKHHSHIYRGIAIYLTMF